MDVCLTTTGYRTYDHADLSVLLPESYSSMSDDVILLIIWILAFDQVLGFIAWAILYKEDPEKYEYNWRIFSPLITPYIFKKLSYLRWIENRNK
jgi:hypothetical protein